MSNEDINDSPNIVTSLWKITKVILDTLDFNEVVQKSCDSLLLELGYLNLGYRIIVLSLYDESANGLRRIALSSTPEAEAAKSVSTIPFHNIIVPQSATDNIMIRAYKDQKQYVTHDWQDILSPPLSPEDARKNQKAAGIKTSMVYPLILHGKSVGSIIFSMIKDISEVNKAEIELIQGFTDIIAIAVQNARLYTVVENTKKQLEEANLKLTNLDRLKDEFVSLASHELRTPMTAIRGSLSTILEGYAGDISDESREFLTAAYNENDRLIRLVNNLLNISRIEAGRLKFEFNKVQMGTVISEVVTNLQMAAKEKGIHLKGEPDENLSEVVADADRIKEVLINLVGNAVKHTYEGGVTIGAFEKEQMITVYIQDTGHGIEKKDHDLLFQKFSQVENTINKETGGTGLGLYISKQIIEGHKGHIWFESELGKGSTFYFSIPVVS
ncbi:sensor histidine kinase [Patescibacteria group bacterium]